MKKQDFYFNLPSELIAQYPLPERTSSRLLIYQRDTGQTIHSNFKELGDFLCPGDLLVLNNSKVLAARLHGSKASGGKIELLVERVIDKVSFFAHIKASKAPKAGTIVSFPKGWQIKVLEKLADLYHCQLLQNKHAQVIDIYAMLAQIGDLPLPPYIKRSPTNIDSERYQTVYAEDVGSVAAPTAGLHFDQQLLDGLRQQGINIAYTTLHVGAGTFQPLRADEIVDHRMHKELFSISSELGEAVINTKLAGKRVIAVGTTAMRSLEAAACNGKLKVAENQETDIFITPGYRFKICDGLLTNFHLPESTLIILVSAFIGHMQAMTLYNEAIANKYRFFSYGDTSLLL